MCSIKKNKIFQNQVEHSIGIHTGGTGGVVGYQQVASLAQSLPDSAPKHSTSTKLINTYSSLSFTEGSFSYITTNSYDDSFL